MANRYTRATWNYHDGTKHPGGPLMNPHHRYDPMRNPLPFKIYEDLDPIPLSLDFPLTSVPALAAIATPVSPVPEEDQRELVAQLRLQHRQVRFVGHMLEVHGRHDRHENDGHEAERNNRLGGLGHTVVIGRFGWSR